MMVNTVKGKIEAKELKVTLIHEHLTCADWSMKANFGEDFFQEDKVAEMALYQLNKAKEQGLHTFVDGTPINLGRDIGLLKRVGEVFDGILIVSSGFYYQVEPWLEGRSKEAIRDMLQKECYEGIGNTNILPGLMKAGVAKEGVSPYHKKILSATASVAAERKLPLFCHHDPAAKSGYDILRILTDEGLNPCHCVLGHSGDSNDINYLKDMAKEGLKIGFDRLGYCEQTNSIENYVKNIYSLCELGYENNIVISQDLATYLAFWDDWNEVKKRKLDNIEKDFSYIFTTVIPTFIKGGISKETIQNFLVRNTRDIFEL